jgi:Fe2+ or Zn2+ uptake regulation protein
VSTDVLELLKKASLRATAPRLAVLRALETEGKHKDAESIVFIARKLYPSLSRQAVYDNLNTLTAKGVIRRIEPAGSPALYETRVGDNHHHLICRICKMAVDVDCVVGEKPCLQIPNTHGFTIDEAEIVFWGICPQCQERS